jgi:hypothetical protein
MKSRLVVAFLTLTAMTSGLVLRLVVIARRQLLLPSSEFPTYRTTTTPTLPLRQPGEASRQHQVLWSAGELYPSAIIRILGIRSLLTPRGPGDRYRESGFRLGRNFHMKP